MEKVHMPLLRVNTERIDVIGGGTISHVRNHLALCAPAYGATARFIVDFLHPRVGPRQIIELHLTRMADEYSRIETNDDVATLVDTIVADPQSRIVFFNPALVDFDGQFGDLPSGKHAERLQTKHGEQLLIITPTEKLIGRFRKERKDIFVVGFKTTTGASLDEQYIAGLDLLKKNSLNLVLANDPVTRMNMIVTPEESRYGVTNDRENALRQLIEMTLMRAQCTFTRSTVVESPSLSWADPRIPENLRTVVDFLIENHAYKPFRGATAGHFAVKVSDGTIITTKRKHNYNRVERDMMVLVEYEGDDRVIAHGAKPSVGGQSQRIIFTEHPEADCIVHFHCPPKVGRLAALNLPVAKQMPYECGSHQCGANTSRNLHNFGNLKAVYLDNHGPNIVFGRETPAAEVIDFIAENFDLADKTGGVV